MTFGFKPLQHTDHLDSDGEQFLTRHNIPVLTIAKDKAYLEKYGVDVSHSVDYWQSVEYLGGQVTAIPAQHGHGWIHKCMANGAGFYIALPNEPTLYICGDTVLTDDVKQALDQVKPDYAVLAAGEAQMDVGKPLLMSSDELLAFIRLCPGKVIANHMEALNHCPLNRQHFAQLVKQHGLQDKVLIPLDGQTLELK